jgi:hypothetical protein
MKLKLSRPFVAENRENCDEVNCYDYIPVSVHLAGRRHVDSELSLAAQLQAWTRLSDKEFAQLDYADFSMLADQFTAIHPAVIKAKAEEAKGEPDPKA